MIKILFPPGCYGTYLARCLYSYTELRKEQYQPFTFDLSGSSHAHRINRYAKQQIGYGHYGQLYIEPDDQVVTIVPDKEHFLDYYDNQFHKENGHQIIFFMNKQLSNDEITNKLKNSWNYTGLINDAMPRWILREFCSLWIQHGFDNGYNIKKHQNVNSVIHIGTEDIFIDFGNTIKQICERLNLTIDIDLESILTDNKNFCSLQGYHDIQIKCNNWVLGCLENNALLPTPCKTIFDEVYIQHLFRKYGYEIQCNELDIFPTMSKDMISIIYKN